MTGAEERLLELVDELITRFETDLQRWIGVHLSENYLVEFRAELLRMFDDHIRRLWFGRALADRWRAMLIAVRLETILGHEFRRTIEVFGIAAAEAVETVLTVAVSFRVDEGTRAATIEVFLEARHLAQSEEALALDRLLARAATLALAFAFASEVATLAALAALEAPGLTVAALRPSVPITAGVAAVGF